MKKSKNKPSDVGVIVGRFQIDKLHEAHINLIQGVCDIHPKVIIFLGVSPCMVTRNNPLDFESRKQMILEQFPKVNVLYVKDTPDDNVWSKDLDEKIGDLITPSQTVTLYGGRDSFIKYYGGKHKTQELLQEVYISASEVRDMTSKRVMASSDFRAGIIWGVYNQYPKVYPTVDVAIFDAQYRKVLLGRKPKEDGYRFIGGFAAPESESYEVDARREVMEETGLEIGNIIYIGSYKIADWRYKNEQDKIKTVFFKAKITFGTPKANDDIAEVRFFDIKELNKENVVNAHHILLDALKK